MFQGLLSVSFARSLSDTHLPFHEPDNDGQLDSGTFRFSDITGNCSMRMSKRGKVGSLLAHPGGEDAQVLYDSQSK